MRKPLRIIQANVAKMPGVHQGMLNDKNLAEATLLLIQEPSCWLNNGDTVLTSPNHHAHFSRILPSKVEPRRFPIRSLIWAHNETRTQQIPVASADITAVLLQSPDRPILAVSVYIPPGSGQEAALELSTAIQLIHDAVASATEQVGYRPELVLAGDFNRHDQLWGGDHIALSRRQGEAEAIINMMQDLDLQSTLSRGTITYEAYQGESTIDLMLVSSSLAQNYVYCKPLETDYGSDHRPIETLFELSIDVEPQQRRRAFRSTDWQQLRESVKEHLETHPIDTAQGVNEIMQQIDDLVQEGVRKHVPWAKPSLYGKRWWTTELTQLRQEYTYWRNRVRAAKRAGLPITSYNALARAARETYRDQIREHKRRHWAEFLDDTTNIWKAAKYLKQEATPGFAKLPAINTTAGLVSDTQGISTALLQEFFPPVRPVEASQGNQTANTPLPSPPLTEEEIERALRRVKPWKAAGDDGLPAGLWQQLWPVLKDVIILLFRKSIQNGELPNSWKRAKIIPLRKPDKPDYTLAKAYRPISLLSTLSKVLESIVAERISFLAEKHDLLPQNHFGARKRRSAPQALAVLQERIYEAWRKGRVLSLVSFDVKGAYNGVNRDILLARLRQRNVPETLVNWVKDFCSDRQACIVVNNQTSTSIDLPQAGLPQGSPLSPILFLFFNADLVQNNITDRLGSIAFVDDFSAWVTGHSASENTNELQLTVIPRTEQWERTSGATFEATKTTIIHFTRNRNKDCNEPLRIKGTTVVPGKTVKLLGVVLDQQLRYKHHAGRIAKRGLHAALALKRLRGLRPDTARQLFLSTIAPIIDYASPIWSSSVSGLVTKLLQPVQKVAAQAIIGIFRTTAIEVAEAEAAIEPLCIRWQRQRARFWTSLATTPKQHPYHQIAQILRANTRRFQSPLLHLRGELGWDLLQNIETIYPVSQAPWQPRIQVTIQPREEATHQLSIPPQDRELLVYTAGVIYQGTAAFGVTGTMSTLRTQRTLIQVAKAVGKGQSISRAYLALAAIREAILFISRSSYAQIVLRQIWISTSSQEALSAITQPRYQSGQTLVHDILDQIEELQSQHQLSIKFRWAPSGSKDQYSILAHQAAKTAAFENKDYQEQAYTISAVQRVMKKQGEILRENHFKTRLQRGRYSRLLDKALPGPHTRKLYSKLNRKEAAILSQLRTGKCRLNTYLNSIAACDTPDCTCGQNETVKHFVLHCTRWQTQRRELMAKAGKRWGDISFLLGGWTNTREDGAKAIWQPNYEVVRATIKFAMETGRLDAEDRLIDSNRPDIDVGGPHPDIDGQT